MHHIITEVMNCAPISHFLDISFLTRYSGEKGLYHLVFPVAIAYKKISRKWPIGAQFNTSVNICDVFSATYVTWSMIFW